MHEGVAAWIAARSAQCLIDFSDGLVRGLVDFVIDAVKGMKDRDVFGGVLGACSLL